MLWVLVVFSFSASTRYYNEIISTHPSVALSDDGDTEDVDELAHGMIEAAQVQCSPHQLYESWCLSHVRTSASRYCWGCVCARAPMFIFMSIYLANTKTPGVGWVFWVSFLLA